MDPFADLVASLKALPDESATHARLDLGRESRKGVPEVIYAPGKSPELVLQVTEQMLASRGKVIVSRPSAEARQLLFEQYEGKYRLTGGYTLGIEDPARPVELTGGRVGIITAGSSDLPVAEEATIVARQMGCEVTEVYDVGVAGLHRLFPPLRSMLDAGVDSIVVAAGMDGALPSVVSGLVDVPVIGLPTSTGYGAGGAGVAALLSMLQTCSPGLAVVNIDNGVGAGAMAALIANHAAKARGEGK